MRMELVRCGFGASEMVRIGEFLVLGRRIGTDKRPCGYLEDWPLGFWVNEPTPAVALVLRPMRRNGSVRCGMGAQVCVFDTYRALDLNARQLSRRGAPREPFVDLLLRR